MISGPAVTRLPPAGDPSTATRVAAALRSGQIVAIPTDTVYGLAAALHRPDAIARLYRLKDRPHEKAIPVLLADFTMLDEIAASVPSSARILIERFWPGALTVVVPARSDLPAEVTSVADDGTRTVAVRIPDHCVALQLIAAAGGALAVTSANRSGEPPALTARGVIHLGAAAPDLVVDGGPAPQRNASTVVLALGDEVRVLRAGAIPAAVISETIRRDDREPGPVPHAV